MNIKFNFSLLVAYLICLDIYLHLFLEFIFNLLKMHAKNQRLLILQNPKNKKAVLNKKRIEFHKLLLQTIISISLLKVNKLSLFKFI